MELARWRWLWLALRCRFKDETFCRPSLRVDSAAGYLGTCALSLGAADALARCFGWGFRRCYGTGRMPVRFMRDLILGLKIDIMSSLFVRCSQDYIPDKVLRRVFGLSGP